MSKEKSGDKDLWIIIDTNESDNVSSVLKFLKSPKPKKQEIHDNFICLLYESREDTETIYKKNGIKFKGTPIFISKMPHSIIKQNKMGELKSCLHYCYNEEEQSLNLSDLSNKVFNGDIRFPLNMNYFPHLEFLLFFVGSIFRRESLNVRKLNFDNNRFKQSYQNGFSNLLKYLPNLKELSLRGNDFTDKKAFSKLGVHVILDNDDESYNSDSNESLSDEYQTTENDSYSQEDTYDTSETSEERPKMTSDMWEPRYSTPPSTDPSLISTVRSMIESFIEDNTQHNDLAMYYSSRSLFSILFANASRDSPLAKFFKYNRNLTIPSNMSIKVPCGPSEIIKFQNELFPNGFKMNNTTIEIQFVENLFFAVNIIGNTVLDEKEYNFNRTLTVVGENQCLYISNDIVTFRF